MNKENQTYKENGDQIEESVEFCNDIHFFYSKHRLRHKQRYLYDTARKKIAKQYEEAIIKNNYIDKLDRNQSRKTTELLERDFEITILRSTITFLLSIIISFFLAEFIIQNIGQPVQLNGSSMEPTLQHGDYLIIDKLTYHYKEPERFDIIIFPVSYHSYYIKRIVGLPGETIQIREGKLYINGILDIASAAYYTESILESGLVTQPIVLGKEEYFVLGDNINFSHDSRFSEVGVIKQDRIIGKIRFRIYPLRHAKILH